MKTKWTFFVVLAASLLVLAATAGAQGTHTVFKGKFTLPYEVRWGKSVLEPGEYSMTMRAGTSQPDFITIQGNGRTAVVLVGETSRCEKCEQAELVVVQSRGRRAINTLVMPGFRAVFYHAQPDLPKEELAKQEQKTERIRIAAGGSH
jgi:hypothetical protein